MSARWTLYCVPLSKTFISASSEGTQRMSELRARQNVSSLQHSEQNAKCWSLVPGQHAAASFPHRSRVYTTPERKTQLKKKHTQYYIFLKKILMARNVSLRWGVRLLRPGQNGPSNRLLSPTTTLLTLEHGARPRLPNVHQSLSLNCDPRFERAEV